MKRTLSALALVLALAAPVNARPLAATRGPGAWTSVWRGLVHLIGAPWRLFDDTGGHTIPILSPTPTPGG